MGDLWNPFDENNPVYATLAKELKASRYRVRATVLGVIVIGIALSSTGQLRSATAKISPFWGTRVNQFGVIRRK